MRVLVIGGNGMLGHKVFQVFEDRFETFATFRTRDGPWMRLPMYRDSSRLLGGVDALHLQTVESALGAVNPDIVVNCVGVIKQSAASEDPLQTIAVNALFPHLLAELCRRTGTRLVHVSTDCVFSGKKGNYVEADITDAEDLYGRTKALGEVGGAGCLTLRTSIIGRDFMKNAGLLDWFLSNQGGSVKGYNRAIFTGFPTVVFARIVRDTVENHRDLSGLYHVASLPISKLELLEKIRDALNIDIQIELVDSPSIDRSLNAGRFRDATGFQSPSWDALIEEMCADKTPYDQWRRENTTPIVRS